MVEHYCQSLRQVPRRIVLDVDDTFDAVHGGQQLRLFNAHHDEYGFQPIVVFDGDGRMIAAVLRPASRSSGKQIVRWLHRLITAIRSHWPRVEIMLRADSHYCTPEVLRFCRAKGLDYTLGVAPTSTLRKHVLDLEQSTTARAATKTDGTKLRRFKEVRSHHLSRLTVSRWMSDRQQVAHATPAWIVTVVGLLDVPLALPSRGLPPMHGVMVLGLALGLFFAVSLFTMIFSRLVFEPPMPDALQPTLLILVAPFAVGFSTYVATTGQVDLFAESLYVTMLFMLAVLVGRLRHLPKCCPFRISWWAVSFPLAACAIAALQFAAAQPGIITDTIAMALLAFATFIVAGLLARTLVGVARGELRTLSS